MKLNKLLLNPSKTSHWHRTITSQIFWSFKLISQHWYHPSQFLCSQSWLHLRLWHVLLWSNQLCIQILSFSYPRHPSNSSSSSSFYSHSSCKFTCLQQTWLLQFTLLWHITNKSQQTSTHSKFIGTCHYKHFKYQHITPTFKKLHWLPIKQRMDYKICLLTYKTLTNQQPSYLYNSLSFPSHSVSTRSSDSLVLSIPCQIVTAKGLSLSSVHDSGIHSIPLDTRNSSSLSIFPSRFKTHFFRIALIPFLGSFPSPLTVYPDFDSCYSRFMPYRMTPSVRHRATEVHY